MFIFCNTIKLTFIYKKKNNNNNIVGLAVLIYNFIFYNVLVIFTSTAKL